MGQKSGKDRGAVIIVPIDAETGRMVLVIERSRPEPHYWKFPAGGIDDCDTDPDAPQSDLRAAFRAAIREAKEETGLDVNLLYIGIIPRPSHRLYAFIGLVDRKQLKAMGDEGEIPNVFSLDQIRAMQNFMPTHQEILGRALEKLVSK